VISLSKYIIHSLDLHQEPKDKVVLVHNGILIEDYLEGPFTLEHNIHMVKCAKSVEELITVVKLTLILVECHFEAVNDPQWPP
jgi:hypothetical protein